MSCASTTTLDVIWTPKPTALLLAPAPTLYWTGIPNVFVAGLFGATSSCALEFANTPAWPASSCGGARKHQNVCGSVPWFSRYIVYLFGMAAISSDIWHYVTVTVLLGQLDTSGMDKAAVFRVVLEVERCLKSRFLPVVAFGCAGS